MVEFTFTRDSGQGDPSGFDLGDIDVTGALGSATSRDRNGVMIFVAVTDLLDGLRRFLTGKQRAYEFIGADSSFALEFTREKNGVLVSARGEPVGRLPERDLVRTVWRAAEGFMASELPRLPADDAAREDLTAAARDFEMYAKSA